jgi:hypothetical protein
MSESDLVLIAPGIEGPPREAVNGRLDRQRAEEAWRKEYGLLLGNVDEGLFFLHDLHLSIPSENLFGGLARSAATRISSERKNRTHSHDHPEGH